MLLYSLGLGDNGLHLRSKPSVLQGASLQHAGAHFYHSVESLTADGWRRFEGLPLTVMTQDAANDAIKSSNYII